MPRWKSLLKMFVYKGLHRVGNPRHMPARSVQVKWKPNETRAIGSGRFNLPACAHPVTQAADIVHIVIAKLAQHPRGRKRPSPRGAI